MVNAPLLSDLEDFSLVQSEAAFAVAELARGQVFTGAVHYTIRAVLMEVEGQGLRSGFALGLHRTTSPPAVHAFSWEQESSPGS